MQIRVKDESDGKCFARMVSGCLVLGMAVDDRNCGTYRCKLYKPEGCKDWIRLDKRDTVRLFEPEELGL